MTTSIQDNVYESERSFDNQYDILEKVGEGAFGNVYVARHKKSGECVAVKQMKFYAEEEGIPGTAIREISILKQLSHTNVVRLHDVFCKPDKLVLVFELLKSDLNKFIRSLNGCLSTGTIKKLARQLCCGMEFCHANCILHRDIKPQNLLVDEQLHLKIADFGLARAYSVPIQRYTHDVVTLWYRPPEILLGATKYSLPVDLWSAGCVLGEMASGGPLFAGDSEIDTVFKIFQNLGTPTEHCWPGISDLPDFKPTFPKWQPRGWANIRNTLQQVGPEGVELLERFMCYNPRKRISAREALSHPYFKDAD